MHPSPDRFADGTPGLEDDLFDPEEALDDFMPEGFDWRHLVREYPLASLLMAGLGGYILGRNRGVDLLEDLSGFAAGQVVQGVNEFLGEDVL